MRAPNPADSMQSFRDLIFFHIPITRLGGIKMIFVTTVISYAYSSVLIYHYAFIRTYRGNDGDDMEER